jgi:hypothetical protein
MYCRSCGIAVDSASFCAACGTPFLSPLPAPTARAAQSRRMPFILAVVAVCVTAFGLMLRVAWEHRNDPVAQSVPKRVLPHTAQERRQYAQTLSVAQTMYGYGHTDASTTGHDDTILVIQTVAAQALQWEQNFRDHDPLIDRIHEMGFRKLRVEDQYRWWLYDLDKSQ